MTDLARQRSSTISLPANTHPTSTGLLMAEISRDDHEHIGRFLASVDSASQWWQGDWFNAIDAGYGEHEDVCRQAGLNYDTVRNYARVCVAIEYARRRANLSFGHHEAVAVSTMEDEEQDALLDDAEKCGLSVRQLRNRVGRRLNVEGDDPTPLAETAGTSVPHDVDDSVPRAADNSRSSLAHEPEPAVVDAEDRPVPKQLEEIFTDRLVFASILNRLRTIAADLTKLRARRSGTLLAQDASAIEQRRRDLYSYINFAQPHATCPYCDADKKACRACHGSGWVNKVVYSQAPPRSTAAGNGGSDDSEIPF